MSSLGVLLRLRIEADRWRDEPSVAAALNGAAREVRAVADQLATVRGQRDVLLQLLRDAADVLHTVVGEDADEERELQALRQQIADACAGVMAQIVEEAQG